MSDAESSLVSSSLAPGDKEAITNVDRANSAIDVAQDSDEIRAIGFVISNPTGRTPSFNSIEFRLKGDQPSPQPGAIVAIEARAEDATDALVIARVENVFEVNPHEDALSSNLREVLPIRTEYAPEGSSTVIYRVGQADALEEALLNANGDVTSIREFRTLPRAGAAVYVAPGDLISNALGLETEPEQGIDIGSVEGSSKVRAVLKKSAIQRHLFICGGIGTGKSYTRGVIAEELAAWGVPQVNIDVNGELTQATDEIGGINLDPGTDFTLPLSAFTAEDILNAIPSLSGLMIELVRHAHEELLKDSLKTGGYFLLRDLLKKMEEVAPTLELKPVTVKPALGRTSSLGRIKYIGEPYDWSKALVPGALININCKGLLVSDLRIITAAVARDLQRLGARREIPFVVLSIDEFHLVAPSQEDTVCRQVLRELARVGRHHRIGLILTTQSPSDVDRSILKRMLTRFLHAIEPDQLESLRGVFSDASEDLIRRLPKLPQGVCVLTGVFETVRHAALIRVRERLTTHGGATPDIWSDFEKRGWKGKKPLNDITQGPRQGRLIND